MIVGLDPGPEKSSIVHFDGKTVLLHVEFLNDELLNSLRLKGSEDVLVIEQIESFGMAVGREVFETVFWSGRFAEAWSPDRFVRMPRRTVKTHICHSARATDANIRTELIDRFGGSASIKKGGPLYGVKSHCWAALALAVTYYDMHVKGAEQATTAPMW